MTMHRTINFSLSYTDFTFSPSPQNASINQTLVFPSDGYVDGILNFNLTLTRVASNVTGLRVTDASGVSVIVYDPDGKSS